MIDRLSQNRWALTVRGVLAILFGIAAIVWPGGTLQILVLLFGAYILVDGVFAMIGAIRFAHEHERWLPLLLEGVLGIVVGGLIYLHPVAATVLLFVVIGVWALVSGVLEIVAAVRLRRHVAGEWLLGLTGVLSVIVGLVLLLHPLTAGAAYTWVLGFYAVFFGISLLSLAYRLRGGGGGMGYGNHPPTTAV